MYLRILVSPKYLLLIQSAFLVSTAPLTGALGGLSHTNYTLTALYWFHFSQKAGTKSIVLLSKLNAVQYSRFLKISLVFHYCYYSKGLFLRT